MFSLPSLFSPSPSFFERRVFLASEALDRKIGKVALSLILSVGSFFVLPTEGAIAFSAIVILLALVSISESRAPILIYDTASPSQPYPSRQTLPRDAPFSQFQPSVVYTPQPGSALQAHSPPHGYASAPTTPLIIAQRPFPPPLHIPPSGTVAPFAPASAFGPFPSGAAAIEEGVPVAQQGPRVVPGGGHASAAGRVRAPVTATGRIPVAQQGPRVIPGGGHVHVPVRSMGSPPGGPLPPPIHPRRVPVGRGHSTT